MDERTKARYEAMAPKTKRAKIEDGKRYIDNSRGKMRDERAQLTHMHTGDAEGYMAAGRRKPMLPVVLLDPTPMGPAETCRMILHADGVTYSERKTRCPEEQFLTYERITLPRSWSTCVFLCSKIFGQFSFADDPEELEKQRRMNQIAPKKEEITLPLIKMLIRNQIEALERWYVESASEYLRELNLLISSRIEEGKPYLVCSFLTGADFEIFEFAFDFFMKKGMDKYLHLLVMHAPLLLEFVEKLKADRRGLREYLEEREQSS